MGKVIPFKKGPNLDKILEEIDPDTVNEKVELKHRKARAGYKHDAQVKGYDNFISEITKYMTHHHKTVYGASLPEHMLSGQAKEFLDAAFKDQGGHKYAQKLAAKGKLGAVLDALADVSEQQEAHMYVEHAFSGIDPEDFDTQVALAKQYQSKYASILPKGLKTKKPEQIAKNYKSWIQSHAKLVDAKRSEFKAYEKPKKKAA